MSFRFIHTADWQLGKSFANIPGDAGASLRRERFEAVGRVAALARERGADAVLVAGDSFDSHAPKRETMFHALEAMQGFEGPWVILPGNHDPGDAPILWRELAERARGIELHLAVKPELIELAHGRAFVLPAPLPCREVFDDLTQWMDGARTPASAIRVGLAHGAVVDFSSGGDAKNVIAPDRAGKAGLDYLALGDWHSLRRVNERSYYSGTPEVDAFSTKDGGQALWIEIENVGSRPHVEPLITGQYRWRSLAPPALDRAEDAIRRVEAELAEGQNRRTLLDLTLHGRISLTDRGELMRAIDDWRDRLLFLRVRDTELRNVPSHEELSALMASDGMIGATAKRLAERTDDPVASLALQHLFDLNERRGDAADRRE